MPTLQEWQCPICDKVLRALHIEKSKKSHMETHQEPKYTCDYCDKKFRKKEAYNQHINEHNGIFEYKCEPCNKVSVLKEFFSKKL